MATKVQVEARVLGRREQNLTTRVIRLDALPDSPTLGQLIEHVVRAEVKGYEKRRDEQSLVRLLTDSDIEAAKQTGKVSAGGFLDADHAAAQAPIDVEAAVETALLAHADGLFQVIVDGTPVDEQTHVVAVEDNTSLVFMRLVALAGG